MSEVPVVNAAADAAARRRAKLLSRGADRLAQLQQQPPPAPSSTDDSSNSTHASTTHSSAQSPPIAQEPFYGESLLSDDASTTTEPRQQMPQSPASLVNLLMPGASSSSSSTLLAPDRLDLAGALKSLLIALVGATAAFLGEPTMGAAMSWLFVLWLVSELSLRFVAQRLAAPSAPTPLGLGVVTDLTSSVYAVAGRLCVFVFAFAVTQHFCLAQQQSEKSD